MIHAEARRDVDFDRILHQDEHLIVGEFRAMPEHPRFGDSGPATGDLIVFPRTVVGIQHEGGEPFVSTPPMANFYNRGQRYRRRRISGDGDRCDWFSPSRAVLNAALQELGIAEADGDEPIFGFSQSPCAPHVYAAQRRFTQRCRTPSLMQTLATEEFASRLALHFLAARRDMSEMRRSRLQPARRQRRTLERVEAAKAILSRCYSEDISLTELARQVACSGPHLCRSFRKLCGIGVHAFREQVRLHCALERLADSARDLSTLAVELGFANHSHFTYAFRRAFGCTPSAFLKGNANRVVSS